MSKMKKPNRKKNKNIKTKKRPNWCEVCDRNIVEYGKICSVCGNKAMFKFKYEKFNNLNKKMVDYNESESEI